MPASIQDAAPKLKLDQLLELVGAAQQGIGVFDETDRLVYANDFYRELLAVPKGTYPTWKDILRDNHRAQTGNRISTADFEAWLASAASRRGKLPFRAFESDMHDGRWVHVTETTLSNGWMFCVLTDITELGADERALREQRDLAMRAALSDPLTGLSNRRHIQEALAALKSRGQLRGAALVLLDIDHFKSVNDRFGHDQGDVLLRYFAKLIQKQVRREDLAGRWGGEEFLLLLRDITPEGAERFLERFLQSVREGTPLPDYPDLRCSCSAGITFPEANEDMKESLKRADTALYQAKAAGRDRWIRLEADAQSS